VKIILLAAVSLDGFITRHDEPGSGFTSPEDKRYFQEAVLGFDCLILGSANYEISREWVRTHLRPEQLKVVMTRNPERYAGEVQPGRLEFTAQRPREVLEDLGARGFSRGGLLGGGEIYGLYLENGVVDEVWLTVEPLLFGEGTKLSARKLDCRLKLLSTERLNDSTLLLKYRPL
jgi:dihydrofolate reductase